jgi:hypothetical protein
MVRGMAVATVAGLEARAGGGEGPAPILLAYDPVGVVRRTGRWMNSGAQGKHRDGPPNKFGGIYAKNSPPNQFGGIYAKDAPVNQSGGVTQDAVAASAAGRPGSRAATSKMSGISLDGLLPEGKGGEIATSVPAEIRAQSAEDGGGIASSVPAEVRVQTGHSGIWIASSVPTEIRVQTGHSGTWIASSVPAEVRARAQSAYEQAYTRAYRAYLGASPAAGDPTASPLSDAGVPPADQCFLPCNPPSWEKDRGPPPPEVVQIACCDQRCNNGVRICTSPDPNRPDLCCRDWWWIEVYEWTGDCWYDTEHPCCDPQDPNSPCCTHPETGERCPFTCPRTVCRYSYSVEQHNTKVCADILPEYVRLPMTVSGDCWLCGALSCSFCVSPPGGVWTKCPGGGNCDYGRDWQFLYSVKSDKPVPCAPVVCTPDPCP